MTPESQESLIPFIIFCVLVMALNSTPIFWSHVIDQKTEKRLINTCQGRKQEAVWDMCCIIDTLFPVQMLLQGFNHHHWAISVLFITFWLVLLNNFNSSNKQHHQLGVKAAGVHSNAFDPIPLISQVKEDFHCYYCTVRILVPACNLY